MLQPLIKHTIRQQTYTWHKQTHRGTEVRILIKVEISLAGSIEVYMYKFIYITRYIDYEENSQSFSTLILGQHMQTCYPIYMILTKFLVVALLVERTVQSKCICI